MVLNFCFPKIVIKVVTLGMESLGSDFSYEGIRFQTRGNHNLKNLANLVTWTVALSNSMKVSHAMWCHPGWVGHGGEVWQNVVNREGNGKLYQYSCLKNPMNSMKHMIGYWKRKSLGQLVSNILLEISGEITPETKKGWRQSKPKTQLWMWLLIEARSDAVKNNIT